MSVTDLVVIALAIGVGALAKSITGLGLPLVGVPVLASVFDPQRAVLLMALPTFVSNVWLLWVYRHSARGSRHLPVMLALGVAGAAAGTYLLTRSDPAWLSLLLGLLVYAYLGLRLARPQLRLRPDLARRSAPGVGLAGGLLQGATGLSGPVLATYLHGIGLARGAFVFSITALFQGYALVQVVTFAVLGSYTPARVVESLLSLLPVLVVFPIGMRLAGRVDSRRFEQLLLLVLAVMGAKLLLDGLSGL